jgi:hypothetical protein
MYDVLIYKMLWDRKKILNISLWRIIRLSMRPATGLCPHISLERILVYTVLVWREFTVCVSCLSYGSCDFMVELYSEPGCYTLMEVKVMTDNFGKKIEGNDYRTMYHGKLQTGEEVAVKVWAGRFHPVAKEFHQFEMVRSPISWSTNRV